MGNLESPINEIQAIIKTIRKEIPSGRFFEFGDDLEILNKIESHFEKLYLLLVELKGKYVSKSVLEINRYSPVLNSYHKIEDFLAIVRHKAEGSRENTLHIRMLVDELDKSISFLLNKNESLTSAFDNSNEGRTATSPEVLGQINNKNYLGNVSQHDGQFIYISYAWEGEREKIADQIDEALQQRGLKIIRDKRNLGYKGSIKGFMESIGRGNYVIVVVSDKYLRSLNCMFELVEIAENKQFHDRVFPIVLADADIYDPIKRIEYIKYWEIKQEELDKAMKTLGQANLQGIRDDIDQYARIREKIAGLTNILKDMNTLTPEMHQDSNFSHLYDAIEKRMKGNLL